MMAITNPAVQSVVEKRYRVERQFSSQRNLKELVRDLLRAHSSK